MGRVQQFAREGKQLKPGWAVDKDGNPTTDPNKVDALFPFGEHKGYGLALIDEILAAFIGGSLPTLRSRWGTGPADEKRTPAFFFQCIRPDAIAAATSRRAARSRTNVKAVLADILGHGNEKCMLPGRSRKPRRSPRASSSAGCCSRPRRSTRSTRSRKKRG